MSEFENGIDFEHDEDIVSLMDQDEKILTFEKLAHFELDGTEYVVLAPLDPLEEREGEEDDVAFVFKVHTEDGEEIYEDVEDPDEWDRVQAFVDENIDLTE